MANVFGESPSLTRRSKSVNEEIVARFGSKQDSNKWKEIKSPLMREIGLVIEEVDEEQDEARPKVHSS